MTFTQSLQIQAGATLELRRRKNVGAIRPPTDWRAWLTELFASYVSEGFGKRHIKLWKWAWSIVPGKRPRPFVGIWPREGGKSTSAELAVVALGARNIRPYVWYVRETQDQADGSVQNIMDLLESSGIETYYPKLAEREVGKFGQPRAWRRNRLRTASGFTVDAIGLDTARRGAKVKEHRPGMMVFDDIDGKHDTPKTTQKKIDIITTSLLPAGAQDLAVLAIQNLIIPQGVFARLANVADRSADFLADRIISGPFPAVYDAEVEQKGGRFTLVAGTPSWQGQDIAICQKNIDTWGYTAWLQEAQHEVDDPPGGIWDHIEFQHIDFDKVPDIVRGAVWVDPAVTSTDSSDSMGIQADGVGSKDILYRFYSWERITSPEDALTRAILKCLELGFTVVGVETDQGGDTWHSVYEKVCNRIWKLCQVFFDALEFGDAEEKKAKVDQILSSSDKEWFVTHAPTVWSLIASRKIDVDSRKPTFKQAKAGAGHGSKVARNQRMLVDYEHGKVIHVRGTHKTLERALKRFPKTKPYDLVDAAYWGWEDLIGTVVTVANLAAGIEKWRQRQKNA